jgi:TPR repeat protein
MPRDTELTAESFALLEASAEAGVPEAVRAFAEILFRGHYDQTESTDEIFTPYQGPDRGWLRKVIRDDTKAVIIHRRLTPAPFVVRRNRAKAAAYLRSAFDYDHDDGAAFYLGHLSAKGALSSFEPKRQEIEYPAIPTDPIRAAAYFTIVLHGRPSPAGLSVRAAEELGRLRLDEGDTAAARRLAAQLLSQRPER